MKNLTITITLALLSIIAFAQTEVSIYEIQGQQDVSPYEGEIIMTQGIVTGIFSGSYFIQDGEDEWNGIYVYSSDIVTLGDEVEIIAEVDEYYELTELKNISSFTLLSSGNPLPPATVLNTGDVNDEAYEGVLVQVESALCSNDDLGYGEWELDDGSGPCRVDDMGIAYTPGIGINYSVTGPLHFAFDNYKIEPRDENDIVNLESIFFVLEPEQINPEQTSISLQWETNVAASTEIFYGTTPEMEDGHLTGTGNTTEHDFQLTGLNHSSIYYIRPFSVVGSDTTPNFTRPYATVSNSSGMVKLYFNQNVDHSVAMDELAVFTPNITDTVIHYISLAEETLDITMYEQESDEIIEAINNVYENGVQIRYITDDMGNNPALDNLNENIPVLYGNTGGIMHNKFIIIDADTEMNSWVLTGSLNHTENNLGWDYNNMICIQDKSMARGFTLEFEEMWGSSDPMFNETEAKFGADKTNNTPHKFLIDNIPMELYFSPSDGTTEKIKTAIDEAQDNLKFGVMAFTENSLGNAVLEAHENGLEVVGIIDYVEYTGSEYQYLKDNGVNVRDYVNADGSQWPDGPVFHHKYALMDFQEGAANPIVITGSHNWSASAESINDENTLLIFDANITNQFHQEFSQRFMDLLTPQANDDDTLAPTNEWIDLGYLLNDFIPEDVDISVEIVDVPSNGEVNLGLGIMSYISDEGFVGNDSLSYSISNLDNPQLADTAWIRIVVGTTDISELKADPFSIHHQFIKQDVLYLDLNSNQSEKLNCKLIDLNGRVILTKSIYVAPGNNPIQIDISSVAKGVFLLDVCGTAFRISSKVIH